MRVGRVTVLFFLERGCTANDAAFPTVGDLAEFGGGGEKKDDTPPLFPHLLRRSLLRSLAKIKTFKTEGAFFPFRLYVAVCETERGGEWKIPSYFMGAVISPLPRDPGQPFADRGTGPSRGFSCL